MTNSFKCYERALFIIIIFLSICSCAVGIFYSFSDLHNGGKWFNTAGGLATSAGIIQLEISGFIGRIMSHYGDEQKYPFGPPSYITREIIDNPDKPILTWVRNVLFFNEKTAFWLALFGTLVQSFSNLL